jgi:hypothetical protein
MQKHKDEIIKYYLEGYSCRQIGEIFDIHKTTVSKLLHRNNVKVRTNSESKSTVKPEKFKCRDRVADYWLGFIAADGCLGSNKRYSVSISLQYSDMSHLEKYADWLGINCQVYQHTYKYCKCSFSNKNLHNWISSLGITPNKSKSLKFNIDLNWDIVRGYFDGDGSVGYTNKTYSKARFFSASYEFMNQLKEFLESEGFYTDVVEEQGKDEFYSINFYKQEVVHSIYKKLYDGAEVWLERKRDKFESCPYWIKNNYEII